MPDLKYYPGICLERLRKTSKSSVMVSRPRFGSKNHWKMENRSVITLAVLLGKLNVTTGIAY